MGTCRSLSNSFYSWAEEDENELRFPACLTDNSCSQNQWEVVSVQGSSHGPYCSWEIQERWVIGLSIRMPVLCTTSSRGEEQLVSNDELWRKPEVASSPPSLTNLSAVPLLRQEGVGRKEGSLIIREGINIYRNLTFLELSHLAE